MIMSAAEAELAEMTLEADAAAEQQATGCATAVGPSSSGKTRRRGCQPQPLQHSSSHGHAARQAEAGGCNHKQWHRSVLQALHCIQGLSLSPSGAPALLRHCAELQCLLATAGDWGCLHDWLGAAQHSSRPSSCVTDLRAVLVHSLVRLVDSRKPDVLVKVGAMLLSITPPGSKLLLPCAKMLYQLSKDSANDSRFRHHGVLRPLLSTTAALSAALAAAATQQQHQQDQQHTSTALLFCSGCLKNVSADSTNQGSLGRLGGVSTMAQVLFDQAALAQAVQLQVAPAAAAQPPSPLPQQQRQPPSHPQHQTAAQVAVQGTAVLRNLALAPSNSALFVQQQGAALRALVSLLEPFQQDLEVQLNVSRCLSKLSLHDVCRQGLLALAAGTPQGSRASSAGSTGCSLSQPTAGVAQIVRALLAIPATQPKQWQAGIRFAFALGQLTTWHAEARPLVAAVPGALTALPQLVLDLLQFSLMPTPPADADSEQTAPQAEQAQQTQQQQQQQQQTQAHDFATKVLRVIANLGIDRTIGATLAAKQCTADALVAVLAGCSYEAAEELVLNAAAALTNLAFYDTPSNKVLQADADVLLVSLLPLLTSGSEEGMREAARAVGNLARASPAVRAALVQQQQQHPEQQQQETASAGPYVLQALVLLLDHSSCEVVHSVAGALVNLAAMPEAGGALSRVGLAPALAAALQRLCSCWVEQLSSAEEDDGEAAAAAELVLQCVGNVVTASAAAVSDAILSSQGPRCAEMSCSSDDLACFVRAVGALAGSGGSGGDCAGGPGLPASGGGQCVVPAGVRATALHVQARLSSLWG